jgi:hypothetical protein
MKKSLNKETYSTDWIITKWWEKTIYVIGFIASILWTIGFIIGFFEELL